MDIVGLAYSDKREDGIAAYWIGDPTLEQLAEYTSIIEAELILEKGGCDLGETSWSLIDLSVDDGGDKNDDKWKEFDEIISRITYKPGWYLRTGTEQGGVDGSRMWVQVGVTEEAEISWDMVAGKKVPWRGAKHYLSVHMCRNEIVSTCYHAFMRAEIHEVGEWFRYAPEGKEKGRSIFNPHLDPDVLAEIAGKASSFDTRINAMTMD